MAKNKNQEIQDEVSTNTDLDFGASNAEIEGRLSDVDPLENIPCFVPGKQGFEKGKKLVGKYIGTKRVYSDKFTAGKRDEEGRLYRDLHIYLHPIHNKKFGIWSVGTLGMVMSRLAPGELLTIEYTGLAEKSLKPGQSAPHTFRFRGDNVNLDTVTMSQDEERETAPRRGAEARV